MNRRETLRVEISQPKVRLDKFLQKKFSDISRGTFQRLIQDGNILVDGKTTKSTHHPKACEEIMITWPNPQPSEVLSENIPLEVLFEDKCLLVINKPPGIVVHPAAGHTHGTLVNALLKENRVMTGPEAGITRDAIAINWEFNDRKIKLVDTAGMRRKSKIDHNIEKMSVEDSLRAIRLAQVVILVIDAELIMEKQDLQIADHVLNEGRALIIAVNKWDLIKEEDKKDAIAQINYKLTTGLAQVRDIPSVSISALNNRNLGFLMQSVLDTYTLWNKRISTSPMNRWLAAKESQNPAPLYEGKSNRLKYITQINIRPPTFSLWVSRPKELPDTYKRYLMNGLREDFDLQGIPIRLLIRTSKNPYENTKKKTVKHKDKKKK